MFSHLHNKLSSICMALLCAMTLVFASSGGASAQTQFIIGSWSLVWEGARDNYTGTLRVTAGKKDDASKLLPGVFSAFDKAVKSGVVARPTANRKKSRLSATLK